MINYPSNYRDNNPMAGGTFKQAETHVIFHDVRVGHLPEEVNTELSYLNEYTNTWQEVLQIEREYLVMAQINYQKRVGQRMQSTKTFIELVVNLNKDHTMEDVKKVAKMMEELYGIKMTFAAIHRDEGYYDKDTGDFIANVHAHIRFCTLDLETGLNGMSKAPKTKLITMQTKFAEILGLKPGEKGKKQRHISAKDYKHIAKSIDDKFRDKIGDLGLDKVKDLKKFQDFVIKQMKTVLTDLDPAKVDLDKAFMEFLEERSKQTVKTLVKNVDKGITTDKEGKPAISPIYKSSTLFGPIYSVIADKMTTSYQAGYDLAASEVKTAPVVDYSSMSNFNINVGAGAKFQNVVMAGTSISVEAGASITNCQFNDKEPINLPKCTLSNCIVDPLPNYGILAGKSFAESYFGDDQGYLVINGVSTKPKQPELELRRRSSVDSHEI